MTEDASGPSQPGPDWRGILGALQLGNSPDGAASLDSSEPVPLMTDWTLAS